MTLALGKSDADFFRPLLRLALPMAAQGMVTNLLNAIDVFMIGQLGETAVAAVGLSNQIFFLMTLFLFGVGSGSAIFSAQFWGKGDLPSVRRTLGLSLLLGVTGAILFSLAALLAPERLLGLYTADPAVVAAGVPYLRLVALCYVPFSITNMYGLSLRSTRVVQVPMVVSIGALTFKALIGYALIFGYFGLPALGVVGAAAATVIARLVEMAAMLIVTYRLGLPAAARPRELIGFPRSFYSRFARTTAPVILGEVLWSLGFTTYVAIYARIGTDGGRGVQHHQHYRGCCVCPADQPGQCRGGYPRQPHGRRPDRACRRLRPTLPACVDGGRRHDGGNHLLRRPPPRRLLPHLTRVAGVSRAPCLP